MEILTKLKIDFKKLSVIIFNLGVYSFLIGLILVSPSFLTHSYNVKAAMVFQDDSFGTIDSDSLLINAKDHSSGDISIQFGKTLAESLKWDNANTRFILSDDLRIEGNAAVIGQGYIATDHAAVDIEGILNLGRQANNWESLQWDKDNLRFDFSDSLKVNGSLELTGNIDLNSNQLTEARVENLGSAPTCNVGAKGRTYLDTTDNSVYYCNGTLNIKLTSTVGHFYDSSGGLDLDTAAFVAIPFNQEKRKDSGFTHSTVTNNSRVTLNTAGWYRVSYNISHTTPALSTSNITCKLRLNGTSDVIPSRTYSASQASNEASNTTTTTLETTSANEYYEVMCNNNGSALLGTVDTIANESWTLVEKI